MSPFWRGFWDGITRWSVAFWTYGLLVLVSYVILSALKGQP